MIIGKIKPGEGLGDMLFSYILTRVVALDNGFDFGFVGAEFFKGRSFMNLDFGKPVDLKYKIIPESGDLILEDESKTFIVNTPYYNPEINFLKDGMVIDGYGGQSEQYWGHRLDEVREWLKVEPLDTSDKCIINFRGGEYVGVPDLFLPREYWYEAINSLNNKYNNKLLFEVHTDDIEKAKEYFGHYPIIEYKKDIELNWRSIRYAKYAIISNSAFAIIPRLLAHLDNEDSRMRPDAITIAPFGWNARNASTTKWLGRPSNYYPKFTYV